MNANPLHDPAVQYALLYFAKKWAGHLGTTEITIDTDYLAQILDEGTELSCYVERKATKVTVNFVPPEEVEAMVERSQLDPDAGKLG